jgi:hypothetical protein
MKTSNKRVEQHHPTNKLGTGGLLPPVHVSRFGPAPRSETLTGVLASIGIIAEDGVERTGGFSGPIRENQREFSNAIDLVHSAQDNWTVDQEVNKALERLRVRRVDERRREQARCDAAAHLWLGCVAPHGSATEWYLTARGCTLPDTPYLRHHDYLFHPESKTHLRAMVAGVTVYPSRVVRGVHRTFLQVDGRGKANVNPAKMMLGSIKDGAVRLGPPSPRMGIAEGIETALACQQATGIPTWAALSSGNLAQIALPPVSVTTEVVIFADRDEAGIKAAEAAATRLLREGRRVRIAKPPDGFNDFNDLLLSGRSKAA